MPKLFGPWAPDRYNINSELAGEALNVLPGNGTYLPLRALSALSAAVSETVLTGFLTRNSDGSVGIFALTAAHAYKFHDATQWDDVTKAATTYSVTSGERWTCQQWGDTLVAVARGIAPQTIVSTNGTNFTDLGGTPPQAGICRVVGDFLMLGDLASGRNQVAWSSRNDNTTWVYGDQDSDLQEFPDGGIVTGIAPLAAGPLQGVIIQEQLVRRFGEINSRMVFTMAPMLNSHGCIAPYSIVCGAQAVYYLSQSGFVSTTMAGQTPIGKNVVDDWFNSVADQDRIPEMVGVMDPVRHRFMWAFHSTGHVGSYMDQLICYDPEAEYPWTHAEVSLSTIMACASPGYTLEGLDALFASLEAMSTSLDSRLWAGGAPLLAGYNSADKLSFFSGGNMAATCRTAKFQPIPGRRAFVNGFRPMTDAANVTGRVSVSERSQTTSTFGATESLDERGMIPARVTGRFHEYELNIAASEDWKHLQGVDWAEDDLIDDGVQ